MRKVGDSGNKSNESSNKTVNIIINIDIAKMLTYVPKIKLNKNPKFAARTIEEVKKPRILQMKMKCWLRNWKWDLELIGEMNVYRSSDISDKYRGIMTYAAPAKMPAIIRATYK